MSRYKKVWRNEPREIKAKFKSICSETGTEIKKGDNCIYYPIGKKVFSLQSKQATDFFNMKFDDSIGYNY